MIPIWKQWLYHLMSAGISGGSANLGVCIIDPAKFNLTSVQGWEHIGLIFLLGFAKPVVSILKDGLPAYPPPTKTI